MVFSSMVFLWIFLPAVIAGGLLIRKPVYQNLLLLAASLLFYAWGEPKLIVLLLVSIFMNWMFGLGMERFPNQKKLLLCLDIMGNLSFLGYFKYCNFFLNTLDKIVPSDLPRLNVVMPIGISFFTFQAMSYVIDLYRGRYQAQKNLLNLALYISFFPQLIAGPIVQYKDIDAQIEARSMSVEKVASGIRRFIYGLGKKVILANMLAPCAEKIFVLPMEDMTGILAWIGAFTYTLQIYYDFSGYSDMAIGLGRIFGFEFLENFDHPYLSRSVTEFWRRWHISLGSWFREYLYIPLGGNRKGKVRTYLNLAVVFALTGLWHGASWNFVGWGIYHGFFAIVERLGFGKILKKWKGLNWIYTFLVAMIGWVFFNVGSVRYGIHMVICMLMPWRFTQTTANIYFIATGKVLFTMLAGFLGMGLLQQFCRTAGGGIIARKWENSLPEAFFCGGVLLYCIMLLANNAYNPFIYFRF